MKKSELVLLIEQTLNEMPHTTWMGDSVSSSNDRIKDHIEDLKNIYYDVDNPSTILIELAKMIVERYKDTKKEKYTANKMASILNNCAKEVGALVRWLR